MIRHAGHRLARKLKLWQNDVLMRASFWQNISLQALLVQKLKISTLDGAKSPGDFFWTIVILHAQIAHLLKSIIVQACTIIFLKSSFQLGVYYTQDSFKKKFGWFWILLTYLAFSRFSVLFFIVMPLRNIWYLLKILTYLSFKNNLFWPNSVFTVSIAYKALII